MRMLFLLLLLAGCQCGSDESTSSTTVGTAGTATISPVVLIGADGFACDMAQPLLKAGKLPHIAALIERGVMGKVETLTPTKSPIIWTTIATGVTKRVHGVGGFLARKTSKDGKNGKNGKNGKARKASKASKAGKAAEQSDGNEYSQGLEAEESEGIPLIRSDNRTAKALWNIADEAGRRVATIGWWVTWPVEKVNGVMVSQTNTIRPKTKAMRTRSLKGGLVEDHPGQVWPPELQPMLNQKLKQVLETMDDRINRVFGSPYDRSFGGAWNRLWRQSKWSIRSDAVYVEIALELLRTAEEPYDLFMVYLSGTDVLAHRFFRFLKPNEFDHPPSDKEVAAFQHIIPKYYEELDRMVGEIVAASPANANIIIVSDHGMDATNTDVPFKGDQKVGGKMLSGGHHEAPPACLVAAGPNIAQPAQPIDPKRLDHESLPNLSKVFSITPTILRLLGLPLADDMPGHPIKSIINPNLQATFPVQRVPTYTQDGWRPSTVDVAVVQTGDDERREQLRALGYIE